MGILFKRTRNNRDNSKLSKINQNRLGIIEKNLRPLGMNGDDDVEPVPFFIKAGHEKVIKKGNSWIVLGKDRDASIKSGYGGARGNNCSSIDMVVGRGSSHKPVTDKIASAPDEDIAVNPNFFSDAARIYLTQRGDLDEYFGLAPGKFERSKARSGIGLKADIVRIVGRGDVKIVSGRSISNSDKKSGEKNSSGGKNEGPGTISLIAGNFTEKSPLTRLGFGILDKEEERYNTLQPLVKGENLIEAITEIVENQLALAAMVVANSQGITELGGSTALHFHDYGGGFGPTTPSSGVAAKMIPTFLKSIENLLETINDTYNSAAFYINYLDQNSPKYLCSRHVFTT